MYGYLNERLALPATAFAALSFLVALSVSDRMVALGIVGLAYLVGYPIVITWQAIRQRKDYLVGGAIACWAVFLAMGLPQWAFLRHQDLTEFGIYHGVGVFVASVSVTFLAFWVPYAYRRSRKTCPECINPSLREARICQYCGYRWSPPLPRSDSPAPEGSSR